MFSSASNLASIPSECCANLKKQIAASTHLLRRNLAGGTNGRRASTTISLFPQARCIALGPGTLVLEIVLPRLTFSPSNFGIGADLVLMGSRRSDEYRRRGRISHSMGSRMKNWTRFELVGQIQPLQSGPGWARAERTGLHALEFIETHRHWFTAKVPHQTNGSVNVLNLVEGDAAIVESPKGAFDPFEIHYAETFIVPAAVGEYTIRPLAKTGTELATLKAMVRSA